MNVTRIDDDTARRDITKRVLEALPDWFGIESSREEYIAGSAGKPFFAAMDGNSAAGFLYLKETGPRTVEIAVMGVLMEYHRRGLGRALFNAALAFAKEAGYLFMQVKTVETGRYPDYDATNRFYRSLGFQEFEVFPLLWDEFNPCQVYVMAI